MVPNSLDIRELTRFFPDSKFIRFNDHYFRSKYDYNFLMLQPKTYSKFLSFKYVLLCEFDSLVIKNLEPLLGLDFTYLGAAWNPSLYLSEFFGKVYTRKIHLPLVNLHELQSGNGGLSLRDTQQLCNILKLANKSDYFLKLIGSTRQINEDILTVFILKKFGILPNEREIANKFFIETTPRSNYKLGEVYGFHKLYRYDSNLEDNLLKSIKYS